jgi:hypothetical protein
MVAAHEKAIATAHTTAVMHRMILGGQLAFFIFNAAIKKEYFN